MKKSWTFFLMSLFVFCLNSSWAIQLGHLKQGDMVPNLDIHTVDGNHISSDALKGKITVLAFWKQDQDDSSKLLADLSRISKQYLDRGVIVLAINGDKASDQQIRQMAGINDSNCLFAGDPDLKTYVSLGIFVLPTTLIIGPDSRITFIHALHSRNFYSQIQACIKYLLGEITSEQLVDELHPEKSATVSKARIKAERYINLGQMLMANAALKNKAFQVLTTAAHTDPSYYKPHVLLAKLHLENKMFANAVAELEQAFKLSPGLEHQDVKLIEARGHADQGHDNEALSIYQQWLKNNPNPPAELYYRLGRIYEKQNQLSLAAEAYDKAAETMLAK